MSSMTLIVDLISIIDQNALFDHGRDGFVNHPSRDSILEESLFDRLLSESILISESIGGSDVTGDCLIRAFLKLGIGLFGRFSIESLVEGIDLRGLDKTEFDELSEGCLTGDNE